jgi:hypothetical protein
LDVAILQRLDRWPTCFHYLSFGGAAMSMNRAMIVGLTACALPCGTAVAAPVARLMPAEIQAMFFNSKPFTAASPSGVKFKMTFTADGKAKRVPAGKGGASSENSTITATAQPGKAAPRVASRLFPTARTNGQ